VSGSDTHMLVLGCYDCPFQGVDDGSHWCDATPSQAEEICAEGDLKARYAPDFCPLRSGLIIIRRYGK